MPAVNEQRDVAAALALSRSDVARPVHADNTGGVSGRLREVAAQGGAYLVVPKVHILAVDVDLPADAAQAAARDRAADELVAAAHRAGVPTLVAPSGRVGHRHVFLVVGVGNNRVRLERWCRERGLDVRNQGIRPPGSPHRSGARPDVDVAAAAAVLTRPVDDDASRALASALCPMVLPGRVRAAVNGGHQAGGYASPSHARMALAVAVRARGGSISLVEAILRDPGCALGETFRRRPAGWQRAELVRVWSKAGVWIASDPRRGVHAAVRAVAGAAQRWPWRGQAGGSDLSVLEELIRVAVRVGSTDVGVALPDLAVGAGLSVDTARRSVRRLAAGGWLVELVPATATTSRVYRLCCPPGAQPEPEPADVAVAGLFGDLGADVARRGAMGKVSTRVARFVHHHPGVTVVQVAQALGMSVRSAAFHLRKLAGGRLVRRAASAWVSTVTAVAVVAVCAAAGSLGAQETQRAQVAASRARRRAALGRWLVERQRGRTPDTVP